MQLLLLQARRTLQRITRVRLEESRHLVFARESEHLNGALVARTGGKTYTQTYMNEHLNGALGASRVRYRYRENTCT